MLVLSLRPGFPWTQSFGCYWKWQLQRFLIPATYASHTAEFSSSRTIESLREKLLESFWDQTMEVEGEQNRKEEMEGALEFLLHPARRKEERRSDSQSP